MLSAVAIARAFVPQPKVVFADEPTGNLDAKTGEAIISQMFELNHERGTTLVLVTHDESLVGRCQRRLELAAGRIVGEIRQSVENSQFGEKDR